MAENTLRSALESFAGDLAHKLETFVEDVSSLEVYTYTTPADQSESFIKGGDSFATIKTEGKATLRAYTQVSFDGDTTVCVPTDPGGAVDKSVWELHETLVLQAMENRNAMLSALGEAAAAALAALRAGE